MLLLSVWWNLTLVVAFKVKRCVVGYNNMPINVYSGALNVYSCVHFYVVQHGIHLMVKKRSKDIWSSGSFFQMSCLINYGKTNFINRTHNQITKLNLY